MQEVRDYVGCDELGYKQVALLAASEDVTLSDFKKKTGENQTTSAKVFKIRKSVLDEGFLDWLNYGKLKM